MTWTAAELDRRMEAIARRVGLQLLAERDAREEARSGVGESGGP